MSRLARMVLAVGLLVATLAARQLALPTSVFACSCAATDPGAPAFTGEEQAVFIGTAGQPQPDGTYRFAVERWFVGGNAAEVNVSSERGDADGAMAINTCGCSRSCDRLIMATRFAAALPARPVLAPAVIAFEEAPARRGATARTGRERSKGQRPAPRPE